MRVSFEELNQIKEKLQTDRLWSWSRVNSVHNSLYEHYLKYIAHEEEDRANSIYTTTGGIAHDILERMYSDEITYEQMTEEFDDGWLVAFEISDLKFDRNDSEKNKSYADKYYKNLKHFFENHIPITDKIELEQFVTVKVGKEWFQGYIDAMVTDKDDNVTIVDWKTSSVYLGDKALNECGQLVLYAIALNQKGIPFDKIKICWNFLKYTNCHIKQPSYINLKWTTIKGEEKSKEKLDSEKLGTTLKASVKAIMKSQGYSKEDIEYYVEEMCNTNSINNLPEDTRSFIDIEYLPYEDKVRRLERCSIGESLQANIKSKMKKLEYDEDYIFETINEFVRTNDINILPDNVKENYTFEDCYIYVDITNELIEKWTNYIIETTTMLRQKEAEYARNHDDSIWMESQEEVEKNSFYFANLCSYSASKHKPYKLYLDKLDKIKNNTGGNALSDNTDTEDEELDLSFLDNTDNSNNTNSNKSNEEINNKTDELKEFDEMDLSWLDEL